MNSSKFAADKMQLNVEANSKNLGVSREDSKSLPSLLARLFILAEICHVSSRPQSDKIAPDLGSLCRA